VSYFLPKTPFQNSFKGETSFSELSPSFLSRPCMKLLVMLLCQTFFMKQLNFTKKAAREIVLQKKLTSEAELCQMGPYTIVVD